MFKVVGKNQEPKSVQKSIRIPLYQLYALKRLSKENNVAVNRVVEMIDYCLSNMDE